MLSELLESANRIAPNTDVELKAKQALSDRFTTPDDVAGLASFLVSEDAAMITGQSVSINGGIFFD